MADDPKRKPVPDEFYSVWVQFAAAALIRMGDPRTSDQPTPVVAMLAASTADYMLAEFRMRLSARVGGITSSPTA